MLDPMLFVPYLVVISLLLSVGLTIFDTFFTKRETTAEVVARLKAKGIGSPEDIAKNKESK
jgi:hypothetical protein